MIRHRVPLRRKKIGIRPVNQTASAKRRRGNQRYYHTAHWQSVRLDTFRHDEWRCTATAVVTEAPFRDETGTVWAIGDVVRCSYVDRSQTGEGLVCDEVSYAHRGHETPGKDTRTRCTSCDRQRTPLERANWRKA